MTANPIAFIRVDLPQAFVPNSNIPSFSKPSVTLLAIYSVSLCIRSTIG